MPSPQTREPCVPGGGGVGLRLYGLMIPKTAMPAMIRKAVARGTKTQAAAWCGSLAVGMATTPAIDRILPFWATNSTSARRVDEREAFDLDAADDRPVEVDGRSAGQADAAPSHTRGRNGKANGDRRRADGGPELARATVERQLLPPA